jgi:DNA-binding transcriptional ArsR family regulator
VKPEVISGDLLELVAERMRTLACPLRLRLLLSLGEREACVQELADEMDAIHQKVSLHANALYREGLLTRRREGTRVLYSLADYTAPKVIAQVTASVTARIEELGEILTEDR